jgi:hypothetical protein
MMRQKRVGAWLRDGFEQDFRWQVLVAGVRWAQVAERLMAADCKSAAPWSYGGSNPPLCTTDLRGWMGSEPQPDERKGGMGAGLRGAERTGSDLERRYPVALGLYVVLAVLVWFTMGEGKVLVMGRMVELRLVPLIVIGGLALRTVLARQADRIRRGGEAGSSGTPES